MSRLTISIGQLRQLISEEVKNEPDLYKLNKGKVSAEQEKHLLSSEEEIRDALRSPKLARSRSLSDVRASNEETIARALIGAGCKIIPRAISDDVILGTGMYGTVIEVIWGGRRCAAKLTRVVDEHEIEAARQLQAFRDKLPEVAQSVFPKIWDIVERSGGTSANVIIFELLRPLTDGLIQRFRSSEVFIPQNPNTGQPQTQVKLSPRRLQQFAQDSFGQMLNAFDSWITQMLVTTVVIDGESLVTPQLASKIWNQVKQDKLPKLQADFSNHLEEGGDLSLTGVLKYLFASFRLSEWIREEVEAQVEESGKTINIDKWWKIDNLLESRLYMNDGRVDQLMEILKAKAPEILDFFASSTHSPFPTTISPYTRQSQGLADKTVSPHLKQFFATLQFLVREHHLTFDDLHAGNVMQRPGTGEIVIADIGYLKFT
jgi:hypothetical protein